MSVEVVFFDVGETLVDETRMWARWADWLGVPQLTFFALLGSLIERGEHHQRIFQLLRPGFDLAQARRERAARGDPDVTVTAADLYADALPCLHELKRRGYRIGIAGNQPAEAEQELRNCGIEADYIASSTSWQVQKPSAAFFQRIVEVTRVAPDNIAYVGDRLDNDVLAAIDAGLHGIFLRRGPWALIQAARPEAQRASLTIDNLAELPDKLALL